LKPRDEGVARMLPPPALVPAKSSVTVRQWYRRERHIAGLYSAAITGLGLYGAAENGGGGDGGGSGGAAWAGTTVASGNTCKTVAVTVTDTNSKTVS
jgi:hypothetical protein